MRRSVVFFALACGLATAAPGLAADRWLFAPGYNLTAAGEEDTGVFFTVDYRPDSELFWGMKPQYGGGASENGSAYLTIGARWDLQLGAVQITPYTGPVLYYNGNQSGFDGDSALQFRTGLDLAVPLNDRMNFSAGYFHMSNAGLTDTSADADVVRLGLEMTFD